MSKKVLIIGAGISGLSAASVLAKQGYAVTVVDKHSTPGGRCRKFEDQGFVFDMGPSWYWMPDVFERFFNQFGYTTKQLMQLQRLDPSYKVFFDNETMDIPANLDELKNLFEQHEQGGAKKLSAFLKDAQYKYEVGMADLVYKPSLNITEFIDFRLLKGLFSLSLFSSFSTHINRYFKNSKLLQLLEFPVLFLGAKPQDTPALYSLMNYADIVLGTWYPKGGMAEIAIAFERIAKENGVQFDYQTDVLELLTNNQKVIGVKTNKKNYTDFDWVISSADYHHTETKLLKNAQQRNYTDAYWESRKLAPSSLLYYIGVDEKIPNLEHHNLFFDTDFNQHAKEIYDTKVFPSKPLFYVCAPSKTDNTVAPEGKENLFILIPVATGLHDTEEIRNYYLDLVIKRIEEKTNFSIKDKIIYQKSFAISDFISQYNSFKGNAYGLANTLRQTAIFKPAIKNKKLSNLLYCGQLSVPGPGLPPSIISGQIVANYIVSNN